VLTYLRDSQLYANAAFNGLTIFDLAPSLAAREQEHWQPVLEWVRRDAGG
jgi:chromosome partitioning protein